MKLNDRAKMVELLAQDIRESVGELLKASEAVRHTMAYRGDCYKAGHTPDGEEYWESIPLDSTKDAISRKIVTLRGLLNTLRKELPLIGVVKQ